MDMTYRWAPFRARNPFIREIVLHENDTIVFDGYFYVDEKDLPVQRIMSRYSEGVKGEDGITYRSEISSAHIEIYEKISGEDTSFKYDEEDEAECIENEDEDKTATCSKNKVEEDDDSVGGNICFFPTEITTLKYRVLKTDLTSIERKLIEEVIQENESNKEKLKLQEMLKRYNLEIGPDDTD
jgi:hypothetical protein